MLSFIQNQPDVVDRLLHHIETPSFADLLVRIIQLDEHPSGAGVLEVCFSCCIITAPTARTPLTLRHAVVIRRKSYDQARRTLVPCA